MYHSCPGRHEDPSSGVNPSMGQAVHESRATTYDEISLRVLSDQLVLGLHGHNGHPLDCQPRSQIQGLMKSEPP